VRMSSSLVNSARTLRSTTTALRMGPCNNGLLLHAACPPASS
jgi:hypothetical protein